MVGEPGDPRIEVAAPGLKDPLHSWASGISRGKASVEQGPGKMLADCALPISLPPWDKLPRYARALNQGAILLGPDPTWLRPWGVGPIRAGAEPHRPKVRLHFLCNRASGIYIATNKAKP